MSAPQRAIGPIAASDGERVSQRLCNRLDDDRSNARRDFEQGLFRHSFMALFTRADRILVLVSALVTGHFQRVRESVLLRTLGSVGTAGVWHFARGIRGARSRCGV